jgi:ATP-dependent Clp protease ATP-binding subunit ClpA
MDSTADLKMTPRYVEVSEAAHRIAEEFGHSHVGVEHVFLAIIRDDSAIPSQLIERHVRRDTLEQEVLDLMASKGYQGKRPD